MFKWQGCENRCINHRASMDLRQIVYQGGVSIKHYECYQHTVRVGLANALSSGSPAEICTFHVSTMVATVTMS